MTKQIIGNLLAVLFMALLAYCLMYSFFQALPKQMEFQEKVSNQYNN